jgi:hypothetical protein
MPDHIGTMSASVHTTSTTTLKGAAPPIETAANRSLWRSILDTHGKEILQCASDQFLDLAAGLRLERISARDLVRLPAKAGKLGPKSTNIVKVNALDCLSHEAIQGTNSASKVPDAGTDHGSNCTGSEPSLAEASRGRKRCRKNKDVSLSSNFKGLPQGKADPTQPGPTALEKQPGNNVRQRGGMRRQDQTHMASGKPDLGPSTNVAAVLQSEAPSQRSSTAIKRPLFWRSVRPIVKQSQGTLA